MFKAQEPGGSKYYVSHRVRRARRDFKNDNKKFFSVIFVISVRNILHALW